MISRILPGKEGSERQKRGRERRKGSDETGTNQLIFEVSK
jgi:hypothetical protein